MYKLFHIHRPEPEQWKVIGASVQGTMHTKMGIPCQDAHVFHVLPQGTIIAAISDGASSAQYAAEGAEHAVHRVAEHLSARLANSQHLTEEKCQHIMQDAFQSVQQSLKAFASFRQKPLSAFACTLTAVFYHGDWLTAGQIGDGIAIAESRDGSLFSLTRPRHGEYANETYFLSMETAMQYLEINVIQSRVHSLALMTDGIIRLAMHLEQNLPHRQFFKPLLEYARSVKDTPSGNAGMASFLNSRRVSARTHDDKTLVIATLESDPANIVPGKNSP